MIPLFIKGVLKETPVYINGDGEQTRDFTPVENAVQANIIGMLTDKKEALNKVYNVAMGENFSVNYLFNACKKILQSNFEACNRESRSGDIKNSLADISLAKNLLAYSPTKNFEQGLIETIDFFKEKYS